MVLRLVQHGCGEPLGDRVLDQDPERAETHLAGVVELLDRQADGKIEVGVGEDDQRRLAAELERQRHDVRRGRLGDHTGGGNRTGEGQPADARGVP